MPSGMVSETKDARSQASSIVPVGVKRGESVVSGMGVEVGPLGFSVGWMVAVWVPSEIAPGWFEQCWFVALELSGLQLCYERISLGGRCWAPGETTAEGKAEGSG